MSILDEIAARRQHQIAKGYDAAHDDEHRSGEIAIAAAVYALHPFKWHIVVDRRNGRSLLSLKDFWPWVWSQFHPGDHRENLIDAAAMLVAEVERIDRASGTGNG